MPLSGTWYNELNSEMNLHVQAVSNGGSLVTGAYITKVGNAAGTYSLGGMTDEGTGDATPNVGFSVSWVNPAFGNSNSVTA